MTEVKIFGAHDERTKQETGGSNPPALTRMASGEWRGPIRYFATRYSHHPTTHRPHGSPP